MQNPARTYLENRIMNATPAQLQLMLYEGAIRFAMNARKALEVQDLSAAQTAFENADAVMCELHAGLRPEQQPDLCEKYSALYNFVMRRLIEANFKHDVALIDDAINVLQHLRETWVMVLEKISKERAETADSEERIAVAASA